MAGPLKRAVSRLSSRGSVSYSSPQEESAPQPPSPKPQLEPIPKSEMSEDPPRFIVIGAGSRGNNYTEATFDASNGIITAIAEPIISKRDRLGRKYVWGEEGPKEGQAFGNWREFLEYETERRKREERGEEDVPKGVDGAFICVMDEMHREVVVGLAPLNIHIMCEKPLACSLDDCLEMYRALKPLTTKVFSIGHVLRYSPHNKMLRKFLVEDKVIGDINSVVHTEPVGWWHYTHSYVRGNWRNSETTGPSLLTKSCHDIDLLLWILCSPEISGKGENHLPTSVHSTGGLQYFKKSRKPKAAGTATNCTKCPLGDKGCKYSAKNVYLGNQAQGLGTGNARWPVNVVVHDIEDYTSKAEQIAVVAKALEEDYDENTPAAEVASRNWFGRCVFESDNNVCDDEFVTITWDETDTQPAKRVAFHMVAQTIQQCDRYANYYGEHGEIYCDSNEIRVTTFATKEVKSYWPKIEHAGHGGGDYGLTRQFVLACDKVKNHGWESERAQHEVLGCTLEDVVRSHAMVFAAEEARLGKKVVDWGEYWAREVEKGLEIS